MKKMFTGILLAAGLVTFSGCPQPIVTNDGSAADSPSYFADQQDDGVKEQATPERLAAEQRDRYVLQMRNKLEQKRDAVQAISAIVATFEDDRKEAWQATVDGLETQVEEIRKKIDEVAEADPRGWTDLKQGVTDAWIDLERAVDEAARDVTIDNNRGNSDGSRAGP